MSFPLLLSNVDEYVEMCRLDDGVLTENDMVAYLSGGKQGTQTSFLEINVVGDVLKYAMDYVLPNRNRYL